MAAVGAIRHARRGHCRRSLAFGADILGPGLAKLAENHPCVGDVRGIGGLWALELVRDRETKEPIVPVGATGECERADDRFAKAYLGGGLIPLILGNRVHVAPPLNVSDSDASTGLAILDEALAAVDTPKLSA